MPPTERSRPSGTDTAAIMPSAKFGAAPLSREQADLGERTLQAQLQARRWARAVDAPGDREQVVKDVNRAIKKQRKGKGDEYNLDKLDIYISI